MDARDGPAVGIDFGDPAFLADPYPVYERLRATAPIVAVGRRMWAVSSYRHVVDALVDPRLSRRLLGNPVVRRARASLPPSILTEDFETSLSQLDGEAHARLRAVAARAMRPERFVPLAEAAGRRARAWLAEHRGRERVDLHRTLARPLAEETVAELFGVPEERRPEFARAVHEYLRAAWAHRGPEGTEIALGAAERIGEEIERVLREVPGGMVAELAAGLPLETVHSLVRSLLTAGVEPQETLIGIGAWSLTTEPALRRALTGDPERAVLELLRWRHVGRFVPRVTRFETDLHGQRLEAGTMVLLGIGAAHRDPDVFPDPNRFDAGRDLSRVRAFGVGPATCVAALLARRVGEAALSALAAEPRLHPAGDPAWAPNPYLRSMESLPASLS